MYRKDLSHLEKGEIHPSHPSKWGERRREREGNCKAQSSVWSGANLDEISATLLGAFQSCRGGKPSGLGAPS